MAKKTSASQRKRLEIWKAVVGYETVYQVSDLGRIRRIAVGCHTHPGKILKLKPYGTKKRKLRVTLSWQNVKRSFPVHKIVANAFLGPRPKDMTVNHIDLDGFNNRQDNLEYVTQLGNYWHARARGVMGVTIPDDVVRQIRNSVGLPQRVLAEKFNVHQASVSRILAGKTRTLTEPSDYHNA